MSEDPVMGWLITIKGADQMVTHPKPYFAKDDAERDWYLHSSGQPDRYDVQPAPDPLTPAHRAAVEAWIHSPEVGPMP